MDRIVGALVLLVCIAITVADFTVGLDNTPFPHLRERIPSITLLLLASIGGYLVLERRKQLSSMERTIGDVPKQLGKAIETHANQILENLHGVAERTFKNRVEAYEYFRKRISEAKDSVDDLTWGPYVGLHALVESTAHEAYWRSISGICRTNPKLKYRDVMTYPTLDRLQRAREMLNTCSSNFQLRFYEINHETSPPLIQFFVIDHEEVIISRYTDPHHAPSEDSVVSIRHPEIARVFQTYYDAIFDAATPLSKAGRPDHQTLNRIEHSLKP